MKQRKQITAQTDLTDEEWWEFRKRLIDEHRTVREFMESVIRNFLISTPQRRQVEA